MRDPAAEGGEQGGPAGGGLLGGVASALSTLARGPLGMLAQIGEAMGLLWRTLVWLTRSLLSPSVRFGHRALIAQIVRVGVRSILIVTAVSSAVGLILSLQLYPPLADFGQADQLATIIGVAVLRELGPLIGAIVLTGFAGAAIAAEIGTMVVSEEIEALEAHALNPVRFLVVPRVLAATISMTCLGVMASFVAIVASLLVSITALDIPFRAYMDNLRSQAGLIDFYTGAFKGAVFGLLIGLIACANGLRVSGGAAGVGNATTLTVVQSVVAIVVADLAFTAIFFAVGLT